RADLARPLLDGLAADGFAAVPRDELWFETLKHLAAVARGLSADDAAARLYGLLLPYSGRTASTGAGSFGPIDRVLADLATAIGRYDEAERHFTAAIEHSTLVSAPGWAAHTRRSWADMLHLRARPGDLDRAASLTAEALTDAKDLGLTGLLEDLT
ncbi:hypothetical protein, partial [Actinocorallia lasiicapitis]